MGVAGAAGLGAGWTAGKRVKAVEEECRSFQAGSNELNAFQMNAFHSLRGVWAQRTSQRMKAMACGRSWMKGGATT